MLKNAIAISKSQSRKVTCDSIYSNIPEVLKYDEDYEIFFDEVGIMGCYDSQTHVVSYENATQTLKKLFGKESISKQLIITKENYSNISYYYNFSKHLLNSHLTPVLYIHHLL